MSAIETVTLSRDEARSLPPETVRYLGYPILVEERLLTVLDPAGRVLCRERWSMRTARAFIRGYRRAA